MKLHSPFLISARLLPALRIGDATLSLEGTACGPSGRDIATFVLDFGAGASYRDDSMRSGMQGFRSTVEVFETFLSFLSAAAESRQYEERTGHKSDNRDLFPESIMRWCADNSSDIEYAQSELCDDSGNARTDLIEE